MNSVHVESAEQLLEHAGWLRSLARSLVLDDGEADDLVQDTWLAALQSRAGAVQHPRAWLAGALRNLARGRRRRDGRRTAHELLRARDEGARTAAPAEVGAQTLERERALLDLLDVLPSAQRSVLIARYYEGLSPRAIARRSGAPVETVKSQLKRGLATLRERLDARHGDRATWGAWLLPLVSESRRVTVAASVPGVALGVALVAGAVVLAVGVAAWLGARVNRSPSAVLERRAEVAATGTDGGASAIDSVESHHGRRTAAPQVGPVTVVRVLHGVGGAPVIGAQVAVLNDAALEAIVARRELFDLDMDSLFIEHGQSSEPGQSLTTDERGEVRVTEPGSWLVRAATADGVAARRCEAGLGPHVLELTPACRIDVQVLDLAGAPVMGIPVLGELTLRGSESEQADAEVGHTCERVTDGNGTWFQYPLGVPPSDGTHAVWTEFRIELPGVPETSARARLEADIPSAGPGARPRTLELALPETAPLTLEIIAPEDERSQLDGFVRFEVRAPVRGSGRYTAQLVDGRAEWPRVALGLELELHVEVSALGAAWDVRGIGPVRAGEAVVLRTTRPEQPVLRGRLIDDEARPHAGVTIETTYRRRSQDRVELGPRSETDADGVFRLDWVMPDDFVPPLFLYVVRRSERSVHEGVLALTLADGVSSAALELGDLRIDLAVQPPLHVRCIDAAGAPVAGVDVFAEQTAGRRFSADTDSRGRAVLYGVYAETVPLEVWDPKQRFPRVRLDLDNRGHAESSSEEPLEVVLQRGGVLFGHIERPAFFEEGHTVQLALFSEDSDDFCWAQFTPRGEFEAQGLLPGRWRAEVRIGFGGTVARIDGIVVAAGEQVRDERIDRVRLDTLVRPVRVVARQAQRVVGLRAEVFGPGGTFSTLARGETLLVPFEGVWSARFSAPGCCTQVVADALTLGDEVEVELEQWVRVRFRVVGELPADKTLMLCGIAGTATAWESCELREVVGAAGELVANVPLAGRYRLFLRTEVEERSGVNDASAAQPTAIEVDVPEGDGPLKLELDLRTLARD